MSTATAVTESHFGRRRGYRDSGRQKDDFYRTPSRCTEALLGVETFLGPIWEPACGDGAISAVLLRTHQGVSSDLVDRGYGQTGVDFLMEYRLLAPNIVTNPPFKLSDAFVLHAIRLGAEKIAIFQRSQWLEGGARLERLWKPFPPVRIWQFSSRPTIWRGDENGRTTGGMISYAWFVWERGNQHAPRLGWLT